MSQFPPRPGKIKMIDMYPKDEHDVPYEEAPEHSRFVYLKNGVETNDESEATERIPIVEVHMRPLDENGNLVPKEKAVKIRIKELGPDQRPLRDTVMIKN